MTKRLSTVAALCGLSSAIVFVSAFLVLGFMHAEVDIVRDYISKLGSKGQPYAHYWNLLGFVLVGLLLAVFGWCFGLYKNDYILGACLLLAGFGFALGAIPTDFADAQSPLSVAHYVSICMALAGYSLALARLTGARSTARERTAANGVVVFAILIIVLVFGGVLAEPVAHRAMLIIVFSWVVITSLGLLRVSP